MNIAAQPIELRNNNRALTLSCVSERVSELRAPIEGVGALAGLDLDELAGKLEAL
jgi:hypothetical protein